MLPLLLALVSLAVIAAFVFLAIRKLAANEESLDSNNNSNVNADLVGRDGRVARAGMRRRRGGRRQGQQEGNEDDGLDQEGGIEVQKAVSRKDAYEARRAARDAEREAQEAAQEAEILKAAEEREKREKEEAEKWMHMFSVEEAGEDALNKEKGEEMMKRMVEYLKAKKMVPLEDIAAEFGIRTVEAVEKIKELEKEKRITGIMDDRGKFIYISDDEMKSVAEYIRKKGRITISDLAKESSNLIDFRPREVVGHTQVELDELLEE
jgi:hypothetical protein